MQCRDFQEIADSYLGGELLVETNHEVLRHLEACAGCRREIAARRELHARLRGAFSAAPDLQPRDGFEHRLRERLRAGVPHKASPFIARPAWLALAACLLIAGALGLRLFQQNGLQQTNREVVKTQSDAGARDDSMPTLPDSAVVTVALRELSASAASDHRDCAIEFRLPEAPITLEEAGRKYDHVYLGLVEAVMSARSAVPSEFEFVEAHACVFEGRRFGHVVLRHRGRLVSLLVTGLDAAGQQSRVGVEPAAQVSACPPNLGYQVSCFMTARHAVFVVSDLAGEDNLTLARVLAPAVRAHLMKAEGEA